MKFRSDFVTNSSASSFLIAIKDMDFNERQKDALLKYIKDRFMGIQLDMSGEMDSDFYYDEEEVNKAKELAKKGMMIREGYISFDGGDDDVTDIYQDIWNILEENADENGFVPINTRFEY